MIKNIERGQVWYIVEDDELRVGKRFTSLQCKSRPYLILSNNINNRNAPIVNCVPITTRTEDYYPMHVYFKNKAGRNQIIECEQITTKDISDFYKFRSRYIGTVSEKIIKKVEKALLIQLGILKEE